MMKSELLKLRYSRGLTAAMLVMVGLGTAIVALIAVAEKASVRLDLVAGSWSLPGLFMLVVGALHVTSEYSHNTMRTMVLNVPRRLRVVTAKSVSLAVYCGFWMLVWIVLSMLAVVALAPNGYHWANDSGVVLVELVIAMVLLALIAAGIGFLVRSTPGAIVLVFGLVFVAPIVTLIPIEAVQAQVPRLLINNLIMAMVSTGDLAPEMFLSRWVATAVMAGFALAALALGGLRFAKSDV